MNRICAAFNDIGNINLRNADVPPFNYQMLLSGPCLEQNLDVCNLFCEMDEINASSIIESQDYDYVLEREAKANYDLLAGMIIEEIINRYGSLEYAYPFIVKYLFTGSNMDKATHKQMFWRIFGNIALKNIINNLNEYRECQNCGMKIPNWAQTHVCPKTSNGLVECIDCHKVFARSNSRQQRCPSCQEFVNKNKNAKYKRNSYAKWKQEKEQHTTSLVSRFENT